MPQQQSAGVLLYRRRRGLEVLLIHPGGPYWARKDVWMIPKGRIEEGESPEEAARREFREELGSDALGELQPLGSLRQAGGKWVEAFALEGDLDAERIRSNFAQVEWPPRSGRVVDFPEVDRAEWFTVAGARAVMLPSQQPFLDRLLALLGVEA